MKKYLTIFIVLIMSVFLITGCNKEKENSKLTVAEVTHSVFYAPWYVALQNGYFEDEGLEIEVILTPGADKVGSAVLSGDAQIGLSGLEATMYVYNNKQNDYLISYAALTKKDGQFLMGPCKLKDNFNYNNLYNKNVLVGRKGGMPSMAFKYGLYKNNIDTNKINLDYSVEFASLPGAYIAGEGDYVNLFEPTVTKLEKEKYGCALASIGNLAGDLPYTVFYSKKSFIDKNKNVLEKFTKAIDKGLKFVNNNNSKEIAKTIINEFPNTTIHDLETIIERYKQIDAWWPNTYISKESYNNLINLMKYNESLEKEIEYEIIVDNKINGNMVNS